MENRTVRKIPVLKPWEKLELKNTKIKTIPPAPKIDPNEERRNSEARALVFEPQRETEHKLYLRTFVAKVIENLN